jgi:hypothetical protein
MFYEIQQIVFLCASATTSMKLRGQKPWKEGRQSKRHLKGKILRKSLKGKVIITHPTNNLPTSNKMQKSLIIIDAWEETHSRNFTVFQPFTKIIRSIYDRSIHGGGA